MIEIVPFKAEHVLEIEQQEQLLNELAHVPQEYYKRLELKKWQYTIKIHNKIQACCGVVEFWKNRAECWAMIDKCSGSTFLPLTRTILKIYDSIDCDRIEATVRCDFKAANRFAKLLGFNLEVNEMKKYGVDGSSYALYAKVR